MATFALLLNHTPDRYEGISEDDYMVMIKDYVGWVEKLTAEGVYQGGHKLKAAPGKMLTSSADSIEIHESPFAELSEVLGGLMIIEADDYEKATEIAKTCPHLIHNRSLEIREIENVD